MTLSRSFFLASIVGPLAVIPFTLVARAPAHEAHVQATHATVLERWTPSRAASPSPTVFDVSQLPRIDADADEAPPKRHRGRR